MQMLQQMTGVVMGVLVAIGLFIAVRKRYFEDNYGQADSRPAPDPTTFDNPLQHDDWRVRVQAIQQTDDMAALIAALDDDDYDVREAAADALAEHGAAAVPALLKVLDSGGMEARQMAAQALGTIGDARAIPALAAALDDPSRWVREAATEALRQIATPEAIAALNDEESSSDP